MVELLTKLGLAPYIDEVVAVEDVREAKPAPEAVLTLCERTSVSPGETVVIGDAPYDMEMARRAGVVRRWAIGREAERLKSEGAERAFPNASALLSALSGEQAIL